MYSSLLLCLFEGTRAPGSRPVLPLLLATHYLYTLWSLKACHVTVPMTRIIPWLWPRDDCHGSWPWPWPWFLKWPDHNNPVMMTWLLGKAMVRTPRERLLGKTQSCSCVYFATRSAHLYCWPKDCIFLSRVKSNDHVLEPSARSQSRSQSQSQSQSRDIYFRKRTACASSTSHVRRHTHVQFIQVSSFK